MPKQKPPKPDDGAAQIAPETILDAEVASLQKINSEQREEIARLRSQLDSVVKLPVTQSAQTHKIH